MMSLTPGPRRGIIPGHGLGMAWAWRKHRQRLPVLGQQGGGAALGVAHTPTALTLARTHVTLYPYIYLAAPGPKLLTP